MWIGPAMYECVWLMIVVVSIHRLGEEYVYRSPGRWGRGTFSAVIICIMDFVFNPICLVIIIISLNAFDVVMMFFLHALSVYLSILIMRLNS